MTPQGIEIAHTVVGIVGNIVSFLLFASPIKTFRKIYQNKSVEEFKYHPYVAAIMNCLFWVLYGIPSVTPNSTLVVTINGAGLIMEVIYISVYFIYTNNQVKRKIVLIILVELALIGGVAGLTFGMFHTHKTRSNFVGIWAVIFNVIMYASPLTVIAKVIRTQSVEYMPGLLALANFCNGMIWTSYALIRFDHNILIASGLGTVCGLAQVIIYACYYKKTPKGEAPAEPEQRQLEQPAAGIEAV